MHTAVVEFDALPDPVRPGPQDQHLGFLGLGCHLGLSSRIEFVAGVVVRRLGLEFRGAGIHGFEYRMDTESLPQGPHTGLPRQFGAQGRDLAIRESVVLGAPQQGAIEDGSLKQFRAKPHHGVDLFDEPGIHCRGLGYLLDTGTHPQREFDVIQPTLSRSTQPCQNILDPPILIGCGPKTGSGGLQGAHHFAQCLDEVAAQRHRLAHRLHRGGQCRIRTGELLEGEPRRLHDHVVQGWFKAGRGFLGDVVEDLVEGVADGELGGDLGDRETGGLRRQRARPRHPRVHLDDDEPAVLRVDSELDVATAGVDTDFPQDRDTEVAHGLVFAVGQGHRRRHRHRVTGVHAHRVEVLDRADHNDVVIAVPHQLEFVFLPAIDRFLDQHVRRRRRREPLPGHTFDVLERLRHSGPESTHRERRPHHDR